MPSIPRRVTAPLGRFATAVVRRALGITPAPVGPLERVPDDLPRDQVLTAPLTCEVTVRDPEQVEGGTRVAFRVRVRDATGRRCPDIAVEATVTGPDRVATGQTTTDLLGAALFRMAGGPGSYRCEVVDVAAGALAWDRDGSTPTAVTDVG